MSADAVLTLVEEASALLPSVVMRGPIVMRGTIVMRGLMPRIYPLLRLDDVEAPQGVGPRVKPEGDEIERAVDEIERAGDENKRGGNESKRAAREQEGDGYTAVAALAVPEFRRNEAGIAEAARRLNLPILWVEHQALKGEQGRCLTRSARAEAETGLSCVAEAAALSAAGRGSHLVLPRIARGGVTCALAEGPGA